MSISPQSLARTRDKRSLRIPARFDDFSEIPHEVRTFRNVTETRAKTPKRPTVSPEQGADGPKFRKKGSKLTFIRPGTFHSSKRQPPRLRGTTPAEDETNTAGVTQQIPPTDSPLSTPSPSLLPTPVSAASQAAEIELECKESSFEIHKVPEPESPCQGLLKRFNLSDEAQKDLKEVRKRTKERQAVASAAAENVCKQIQSPSPSENTDSSAKTLASTPISSAATTSSTTAATTPSGAPNTLKRVEENLHVQKSPFHPSITISNGVRLSCPLKSKPLFEKKSLPEATVRTLGATQTSAIPKSTSRKKSRGFSLMAKPPNSNANSHRHSDYHVIQMPDKKQTNNRAPTTKYFNNLTQNHMQYGARLMLNEPIYLPRSVATIAPITTTYEQIVAQSRKPPFISKKAEAYIAYQDERKCNYLTSNYTALVKVTKYLSARDLLNLRLVNKSWKSIVDSDAVWKRVTLNSEIRIRDWQEFANRVLTKYQSSELIMAEFPHAINDDGEFYGVDDLLTIADALSKSKLKKVWIKTVNEFENSIALELLCALNTSKLPNGDIEIVWEVKVQVNDCGIALVPLIRRDRDSLPSDSDRVYCYRADSGWLAQNFLPSNHLVELGDLEDLFNGNNNDLFDGYINSPFKPLINITPI